MVRPGGKLKPGHVIHVAPELSVRILDGLPGGGRRVLLESRDYDLENQRDFRAVLERFGRTPLPPYLGRDDEPLDRERYQTVYGRREGSVAAPTAGLHFTREILAALEAGGVDRTPVTLHVGPGTFRPVDAEDPRDHRMHAEAYSVPGAAVEAYRRCREGRGRVWAVGTTVVRTLESAAVGRGRIQAGAGTTELFVRPPYDFQAVDCLVTNFHLPRSTLLMLVSAFGGTERVRRAYAEAAEAGYRFYSYGDAMAVIP